MYFKIKLRKADTLFSRYIRKRDKFICQRCYKQHDEKSKNFGISHYWGRSRESTRFESDNCISLCNIPCHQIWGHGDGRDEYKDTMIRKLGSDRFNSLEIQANTYKKRDDKMAIITINKLLENLNGNNPSKR